VRNVSFKIFTKLVMNAEVNYALLKAAKYLISGTHFLCQ
jgi:hypothetical protein